MSLTHQMFLQTLRDVARLTPYQQGQYQARLLAKLLTHVETIPVQKKRLASVLYSQDLDHWAHIPPLPWKTLADNPQPYEAPALPPEAAALAPASPPLNKRSQLALVASDCVMEYGLEQVDMVFSGALLDLSQTIHALPAKQWNSTILKAKRYLTEAEALDDHSLAHLRGTPSDLLALADHPDFAGRTFTTVLVDAPSIGPAVRQTLADRFQARVIGIWSMAGIGVLGTEIAPNEHAHNPATHKIEVLDAQGRRCAHDVVGDVVVTSFYEYATPIVRVNTGLRACATRYGSLIVS